MSYIIRSSLRHSGCLLRRLYPGNCPLLRPHVPFIRCQLFATQSNPHPAFHDGNTSTIEKKIMKLNELAQKKNRLDIYRVEALLEDVRRQNAMTSSQALMLIRCCGKLLAAEKLDQRIQILEKVIQTIKDLEVKMDVSHFNALLKVYLENDFNFSPNDILAEMEKTKCEPNRVTYQRLIRQHCKVGDMDGATRVLEYMRDKELPITVSIFNALILGHSNVNDMESAQNILSTLQSAKIQPSPETYATLVSSHVKQGDFKKVYETLREAEHAGIHLTYEDYFNIIETYAKCGYVREIDKLLGQIRKSSAYNVDAQNFCLSLIARNEPEAAYKVLKTIQKPNLPDGTLLPHGDFFISQLIKCDMPSDVVIKYCLELMKDNVNPKAFLIAMEVSLRTGKESMAVSLFKAAKKKNIEIRHHYFWPLLVKRGKENDCAGVIDILYTMNQEFGLVPNTEMIREYVVPVLLRNNQTIERIMFSLKGCGVSVAACVSSVVMSLLKENELKKAVGLAQNYNSMYAYYILHRPLIKSFVHTKDVDSFVRMLKETACGCDWYLTHHKLANDSDSLESMPSDYRNITGRLLEYAVTTLKNSNLAADDLIERTIQSMVDYKVGITEKSAKTLKEQLQNTLPSKTIDLLDLLSSEAFLAAPPKAKGSRVTLAKLDEKTLERLKETMTANNEDISAVQKYLFSMYTRNNDEEKVLKLLKEMEEKKFIFTVGMYLNLLNMYTELGKLDETLKMYERITQKVPHFHFDAEKLLKMVHLLVYNKEADRAMKIMKIHVQRNIVWDDVRKPNSFNNTLCRKILELLADEGDVKRVNEFRDILLSSGLGEMNNVVLGPTIKVHVLKSDIETAMSEFENYVRKYRVTPYLNELARVLIEKENAVELQRLTDLSSEVHGEENAIHNLLLSFIECGQMKQAKKILQMPNFNLKTERILNACYQYSQHGSADNLRAILELTKGINFPERATVYCLLLNVYNNSNDLEKAFALWIEIQEDKLQPPNEFLITLANILKRNDRPVPFPVPQADETTFTTLKRDFGKTRLSSVSMKLRSLISRGKLTEALELRNKCQPEQLNKTDWALLLEACVQENRYEDAKKVFNEYVQICGELPLYKVAKFFLGAAMKCGDVAFMEKLNGIISEDEKKRLSFDNHLCRAYIFANRDDEYLWKIEQRLNAVETEGDLKRYLQAFPRGGILSLMLGKPEYAARGEKLLLSIIEKSKSTMVANTLWIYYMLVKNYARAEQVWATWLCNSKERLSFQKLTSHLARSSDTDMGMKLLEFIENQPHTSTLVKGVIYGHVINALVQNNRVEEALTLLERADERLGIENIMRSAMITLKTACASKSIPFPYEISVGQIGLELECADEHISEELS